MATDDPVTRGICEVDGRRPPGRPSPSGGWSPGTTTGQTFTSDDGLEPLELDGDLPASVNLWGFQPAIWEVFESAMAASGLDEEALLAEVAAGGELPKAEVLLPEVVATMVADGGGLPVRVIPTDAKLVGVTHAADLPVVSAELARQVAWGTRPSCLWASGV